MESSTSVDGAGPDDGQPEAETLVHGNGKGIMGFPMSNHQNVESGMTSRTDQGSDANCFQVLQAHCIEVGDINQGTDDYNFDAGKDELTDGDLDLTGCDRDYDLESTTSTLSDDLSPGEEDLCLSYLAHEPNEDEEVEKDTSVEWEVPSIGENGKELVPVHEEVEKETTLEWEVPSIVGKELVPLDEFKLDNNGEMCTLGSNDALAVAAVHDAENGEKENNVDAATSVFELEPVGVEIEQQGDSTLFDTFNQPVRKISIFKHGEIIDNHGRMFSVVTLREVTHEVVADSKEVAKQSQSSKSEHTTFHDMEKGRVSLLENPEINYCEGDLDVLDSTGTASSSECRDSIKLNPELEQGRISEHVQHEPEPDQLKLETENSNSSPLPLGKQQLHGKSPASTPYADIVTIGTPDTYHPDPTTEEFVKAQDSFEFANDGFVYDVNEQFTYENPVFNFDTMEFHWTTVSNTKLPAVQIPKVGRDMQDESVSEKQTRPSHLQAGDPQSQERHDQELKECSNVVNNTWSHSYSNPIQLQAQQLQHAPQEQGFKKYSNEDNNSRFYSYANPNQLQAEHVQALEQHERGLKDYLNVVSRSWPHSYSNQSQPQAKQLQSQEREEHGLKNYSNGVNSNWPHSHSNPSQPQAQHLQSQEPLEPGLKNSSNGANSSWSYSYPNPSQLQAQQLQSQEREEHGFKNYPTGVNNSWSYRNPNPSPHQAQQLQSKEREEHGFKKYPTGVNNNSWSYSYPNPSQNQAQQLQSQKREEIGIKNYSSGVNSGWSCRYPNPSQHQAQQLPSQEREEPGFKNYSIGVNSGWSDSNPTSSPVYTYAPMLGPQDPVLTMKTMVYSKEVESLAIEHYDNYVKSVALMDKLREQNEQIAKDQLLRLQRGDDSPMDIDSILSPIRLAPESYGDQSVAAAKNENELGGVRDVSAVNFQGNYGNGVVQQQIISQSYCTSYGVHEPQSQLVTSAEQLVFRDMKENEVVVEKISNDLRRPSKPKEKQKKIRTYNWNQAQGLGLKKAATQNFDPQKPK